MKTINILTGILFVFCLIGCIFAVPVPLNFFVFAGLLYLGNCWLNDQFDDPIGRMVLGDWYHLLK